jgi:hypothetical protein
MVNHVMVLLIAQNPDGSWELGQSVVENLALSVDSVLEKLGALEESENKKFIAGTLLAITFMERVSKAPVCKSFIESDNFKERKQHVLTQLIKSMNKENWEELATNYLKDKIEDKSSYIVLLSPLFNF